MWESSVREAGERAHIGAAAVRVGVVCEVGSGQGSCKSSSFCVGEHDLLNTTTIALEEIPCK